MRDGSLVTPGGGVGHVRRRNVCARAASPVRDTRAPRRTIPEGRGDLAPAHAHRARRRHAQALLEGTLPGASEAEKADAARLVVGKAFREMDADRDGVISMAEAREAYGKNPALLAEYFGFYVIPLEVALGS